ncbi:Cell division protein FtsI/penicillin-binding protein 2 [Clostridium cavendishii DSM 21758]|uniref:Cell division protein FtsI/penicillin-binding protein 2 n=1 Tax=Clostridium cavendishii DSM 21758 TaxID=1121302 RepID=A0A1M6TVS9_9CLOT|nr:penicillin-binding protein 2 [Clostridium cavendishii]SHK61145.1 Cell division protein FtsI/penicillin-binding protein 2 [Clostridium cavendishii DSM 21758]
MKQTELSSSIAKVMVVFLALILSLISYIAYFQLFKADTIANRTGNKRLWAVRNEVLRGTIYDRDGNALTTSARKDALNQERTYTNGELYAHVLGYVNPKYSLAGLENKYDYELRNYKNVNFKTFLKSLNFVEAFKNRGQKEEKIGNSVYTTLSPKIQQAAFDALGDKKGAVVALNPKTGEILAMVSKPTYNPNDLDNVMKQAKENPNDIILLNRAVSGMYPPGSTFKTVTLASALENIPGVTNRTFQDNGKIQFNSKQSLSNLNGNAYGNIDLKKALAVSSNVVYGGLAMELGNEKLKATAEKFGFNNSIPSDGIVIDKSKFPTLKSSEKGSIAQSGIGQSSILATPIQMALVASTIANDGVMMEPRLVNEVKDKNGELVRKIAPVTVKSVISKSDANLIRDYMKNIVDQRVNGDWGIFRGTNAAVKTGTADYQLPNGQDGEPHAWTIGFAPAENPQIAVAIIIEGGGQGGLKAAPVVGKIFQAALSQSNK